MLFKGLLALGWRWWLFVVIIDDFNNGFDFAIGSQAVLAVTSLSATDEIVLSILSRKRCSGVGGVDSSTTAIVGRNKEAMTILWLRKEDIDDCPRMKMKSNWYRNWDRPIDGEDLTVWDVLPIQPIYATLVPLRGVSPHIWTWKFVWSFMIPSSLAVLFCPRRRVANRFDGCLSNASCPSRTCVFRWWSESYRQLVDWLKILRFASQECLH